MNGEISDELLHAFADNQLDGAEKADLLERLAADDALRAKVCATWHLKELVRSAHPVPAATPHQRFRSWQWLRLPIAAGLLVALGTASGWWMHDEYDRSFIPAPELEAIHSHGNRVVLHLVSDDPTQIEAAFRKAEQLARSRDAAGAPIQVEFVANGTGVHMLQEGSSPVARRVVAMHKAHANLRLIACNEALERLREKGEEVTLLPEVDIVSSAVSQIAVRMGQGWRYLQV